MPKFESHGLRGGVWTGRLTASERPARICVTLRGEAVAEARLSEVPDQGWDVRVDLPAAIIGEGVTSLIMVACDSVEGQPVDPSSTRLARLNLAAGKALDDDLDAELAMLRSEVELLKREFRRFATRD